MKTQTEKTNWTFSAKESTVAFKIKYYRISSISGIFKEFSGRVSAYDDFGDADISLTLKTAAIELNSKKENQSLRKAECLDVHAFPEIHFRATDGCRLSQGNIREINGELTVKGITAPLTLIVSYAQAKKGTSSPTCTVGLFGCIQRSLFGLAQSDDNLEDDISISAQIELRRARKIPSEA